jgi:hypothetical protein
MRAIGGALDPAQAAKNLISENSAEGDFREPKDGRVILTTSPTDLHRITDRIMLRFSTE